MNEKKVLKVSIYDKTYTVATDEKEEDVARAANMVDEIFRNIVSKTNFKNESKIAVLLALQLAFDLNKEKDSQERLLAKVDQLVALVEKDFSPTSH